MKKLMLICAPVSSRSGYGAHARDIVLSLLFVILNSLLLADIFVATSNRKINN